MITDITHISCAQQGITNSMNQDIRITMPLQAHRMLYFHSAQPQITLRNQCMHIISKPNPHFHHFQLLTFNFHLNKFLIPSISKDREKRSVWSNGFCGTVLIR